MASCPEVPIRISSQRRILLLLHDHMGAEDDYEVPEMLTQKGIGRELGMRQTHVSRALSELKTRGLVGSRSAHIRDVGRKRKVYFLTSKGHGEMETYIEKLVLKKVPVRTIDGALKEYTMLKAIKVIEKAWERKVTIYEMVSNYLEGSVIDISSGGSDRGLRRAPVTGYFFGREEEIQRILSGLEDPNLRFISIVSIAGMGKTSLMARAVSGLDNTQVIWTTMNQWIGPDKVLMDWARALLSNNKNDLMDHLTTSKGFDLPGAVDRLGRDLEGSKIVFILDDLHKSRGEIIPFLQLLKDVSYGWKDCKFIIGSRERPVFYGRKDIHVSKIVDEIILEGLDKESSFQLLDSKGVPKSEMEEIFRSTKGHPMALELIAELLPVEDFDKSRELTDYLEEELVRILPEEEREILFLASVYEQSVAPDCLHMRSGDERDRIQDLCSKQLLRRYGDGNLELHDLLKEHIRSRMTKTEREHFLEIALEKLSSRGSERDILHYMALLEQAGRRTELTRILLDIGEVLTGNGHTQVLDYLHGIHERGLKGIDRVKYLILMSDSHYIQGLKKRSLRDLDEALLLCDESLKARSDEERRKEIIDCVSKVLYRKAERIPGGKKHSEAVKFYKESVNYNRRFGDTSGLGKALNNLGMELIRVNDPDKALEYLDEAGELFERAGDSLSLSFVEANKAEAYLLKRDHQRVREHLDRAGNQTGAAPLVLGNLYRKIGLARMRIGRLKEAQEDLERSLIKAKETHDFPTVLTILGDLYRLSISMGEEDRAKDYLDISDRLTERIDREDERSKMAVMAHLKNRLDFSIRSGLDIDEELHHLSLYLSTEVEEKKAILFFGNLKEELKDEMMRIKVLHHFTKDLRSHGKDRAYVVASMWLSDNLIRSGRKRDAEKILREAGKTAGRIGYKKAERRIKEMLE
ncbi:MAG: NB-ARC domain-containing protein [Thermoplasmatota archaeon]